MWKYTTHNVATLFWLAKFSSVFRFLSQTKLKKKCRTASRKTVCEKASSYSEFFLLKPSGAPLAARNDLLYGNSEQIAQKQLGFSRFYGEQSYRNLNVLRTSVFFYQLSQNAGTVEHQRRKQKTYNMTKSSTKFFKVGSFFKFTS